MFRIASKQDLPAEVNSPKITDQLNADVLWKNGEFERAARIHRSALISGDGVGKDYFRLATFYRLTARNREAADMAVIAGLSRFPDDPYLLTEKFHIGFGGDAGEAIDAAERLYEIHPQRTPGSVFIGYLELLARAGRFNDALSALGRINEFTPASWRAKLSIGDKFGSLPTDDNYKEKRRLNTAICQVINGASADHECRKVAESLYTQTAFSHRLAANGNKTLVVMLSATHKFTLQKYKFDADVLYTIDVSHSYYCIPSAQVAELIRSLVGEYGYEKVILVGCSKAGTGALSIASTLSFLTSAQISAFAFSPQTKIFPFNDNLHWFPSHAHIHGRISQFPAMGPFMADAGDLQRLDYTRLANCKIIYGVECEVDRIECERMADCPGVEFMKIDTGQHYTLGFFTIPQDINVDHARARFAEVDDPDVVAMRSDDAVEEYLEKSKQFGYDLRSLIA